MGHARLLNGGARRGQPVARPGTRGHGRGGASDQESGGAARAVEMYSKLVTTRPTGSCTVDLFAGLYTVFNKTLKVAVGARLAPERMVCRVFLI